MFTRKSFLFQWTHFSVSIMLLLSMMIGIAPPVRAAPTVGNPGIYTLDADFAGGTLVNVNYTDVPNQLQLDSIATPFDFIWVAASGRGTIVKIDTDTGVILGEYWSAPQNMAKNPSRTTVDSNGNVWAGNRDEATGGQGSVIHIGLQQNGQCVDRNGNGFIDTSAGLGDIKPWPNGGGVDSGGGVTTAKDECIIHYVRTAGTNVRTVAVDGSNNVWIGGLTNWVHQLHSGVTGAAIGLPFAHVGWGGYGGLVDANGVLWSAGDGGSGLLRYDPAASPPATFLPTPFSYGLTRDSAGNIWNTQWTHNRVYKYSPSGILLASHASGGSGARGIAATDDDHMWIANSYSNSVARLDNAGTLLATILVGDHPTGVAVDAAGKVWVTNLNSNNVMRIDPATNSVDLTIFLGAGAAPYNYSDMTGSTLIAPPTVGAWTIVHNSGISGAAWGKVTWNAVTPGDSIVSVTAASSADGVTFGPEEAVTNGGEVSVADGQYLKVMVAFQRATTDESPVLYDLTILANRPPVADANGPYVMNEGDTIMLDSSASSDPDGDLLTHAWDLDNDGIFETPGVTPAYFQPDGPATFPVAVKVCDPYGECATDSAMVEVTNVPPTANAGTDQTVYRNDLVTLSGTWTDPAAAYDNPYAWMWDLNGDGTAEESGNADYGTSIDRTTVFALEGNYTLAFGVTDKDGDSSSDTVHIAVLNRPPVCTAATPSLSTIWPVNHKFVPVTELGVTDPEGDPVVATITSIFQDEPVDTTGDGKFTPDGKGVGAATAEVRAERTGTPKVPGNGRVYHIGFAADDGHGGICTGEVRVGVPHDQSKPVVDDSALYDSTVTVSGGQGAPSDRLSVFLPLVHR